MIKLNMRPDDTGVPILCYFGSSGFGISAVEHPHHLTVADVEL
jgi:hypothetical protein